MSAVVDSSGWLEYFAGSANGARFAPPIQDSAALFVPTLCLYEVFKRVCQQRGEEDALRAVGLMLTGTVADLTAEIALSAAQLAREHRLPMADSVIFATARAHGAELWTQDEHFQGLERVVFIPKSP